MYNQAFGNNKQKPQATTQENQNQSISKSKKIAVSVGTAAGIAAIVGSVIYYLRTGKTPEPMHKPLRKPSETGIVNKVLSSDSIFIKEVSSDGYKPFDGYVKGGHERLLNILEADGREITIQDFLTPAKQIHQRTVYRDDTITRYDYARKDGQVIGYAKEILQKGDKNYPEPMQVHMYNGQKATSKSIDDLYEEIADFNPEKMN